MTNEILTPVGRMVQGHPMKLNPVLDKNNVQKINKAGDPQVQAFVALAILKGTEQHWNQTEWGQKIYLAGQAGWPGGEFQAPTFAWKITDGDSAVPNKKGKLPCNNEGFPGHWVIYASNGFAPDCFSNGNYAVQVMRQETFKTGDYVRLALTAKANGSTESPGVYVNMLGCELIQAGVAIQSSSLDAQGTFGAATAALPPDAQVDPNIPASAPAQTQQTGPPPPTTAAGPPAPPTTVVQPAHDFLTVGGQQYTADQLRKGGWTEDQITVAKGDRP